MGPEQECPLSRRGISMTSPWHSLWTPGCAAWGQLTAFAVLAATEETVLPFMKPEAQPRGGFERLTLTLLWVARCLPVQRTVRLQHGFCFLFHLHQEVSSVSGRPNLSFFLTFLTLFFFVCQRQHHLRKKTVKTLNIHWSKGENTGFLSEGSF